MNLRRLAYFVLACQQQGFAGAAGELRVTQSTLSVSLKTLAEEIGMPLFEHVHRRFHPTAAGLWLFRSALPLLHAESFARNWIAAGDEATPVSHLLIDIRLSFALGRVTKAISAAIETVGKEFPSVFAELSFSGAGLGGNDTVPIGSALGEQSASRIVIDAVPVDRIDVAEEQHGVASLIDDPWVLVQGIRGVPGKHVSRAVDAAAPIVVPALSDALVTQVGNFIAAHSISGVQFIDESPSALPRLTAERPNATFLLPRSVVADRLGLANVTIRPFSPSFLSRVVAVHDPQDPVACRLIDVIRENLVGTERNAVFHPMLTIRQVRYHQVLHRWQNMTAAARSLCVAQPALTDQLRKMEYTLDRKLFLRSRDGLRPTPSGERMQRVGAVIENGVRRMMVQRASITASGAGCMRVGILPTASYDSLMLRCIASAVSKWYLKHSAVKLKVLEAPNTTLQDLVASGVISLAIVERNISEMARLNLEAAEPLALIVDPKFGLAPQGQITFAQASKLPLILPTSIVGIRQILDAAAAGQGLKLNVIAEVNSLPLTVALVREQPVGTILPPSAVQRELNAGTLRSHLITEPDLIRRLYAIYSAERNLSEPERDFVRHLRLAFESLAPAPEVRVA